MKNVEHATRKSGAFELTNLPGALARPARALTKRHAPSEIAPLTALLTAFGSFLGAYRFNLAISGDNYYPVLGAAIIGKAVVDKTPILAFAADPIQRIADREEEETKERRAKLPELERFRASLLEKENRLRAKMTPERQEAAQKLFENARAADSRDSVYEETPGVDADVKELARQIGEVERLDKQIAAHNVGGVKYLLDLYGAEDLKLDLLENLKRASARGVISNGFLAIADGAARVFNPGSNPGRLYKDWADFKNLYRLASATRFKSNNPVAIARESCGFLLSAHPVSCAFIKDPALRGHGFVNRLLWVYMTKPSPENDAPDIAPELKEWRELFEAAYHMPEARFTASPEYEKSFFKFADDMSKKKKTASDRGDDDKAAYLAKAADLTASISLVFHIARILDPQDDLGKEYRETGDAAAIPTVVAAETLENAIAYVAAMIDRVWRILYETHKVVRGI